MKMSDDRREPTSLRSAAIGTKGGFRPFAAGANGLGQFPQTGHSRENSRTATHDLRCQFFWQLPQLGCSHLPLEILRLLQFTQQRFGFNQVGSAKAFCEPTVKWGKKLASLAFLPKLVPEPAQIRRCP
jgi:hypothetical protein